MLLLIDLWGFMSPGKTNSRCNEIALSRLRINRQVNQLAARGLDERSDVYCVWTCLLQIDKAIGIQYESSRLFAFRHRALPAFKAIAQLIMLSYYA